MFPDGGPAGVEAGSVAVCGVVLTGHTAMCTCQLLGWANPVQGIQGTHTFIHLKATEY